MKPLALGYISAVLASSPLTSPSRLRGADFGLEPFDDALALLVCTSPRSRSLLADFLLVLLERGFVSATAWFVPDQVEYKMETR